MKNILFVFVCFLFSSFVLNAQENLALGKVATQSSNYGGLASKAVDGNTDGNYNTPNRSLTHTNNDDGAWWQVDLGAVYDITTIKLYNRTDCCAERLSNFTILVSESVFTDNSGGTAFATDVPYLENPVRTFSGNSRGRYIRVFLNGTDYLSLAEVEVYGNPILQQSTSFFTEKNMPDGDDWNQPCKNCLYVRNNSSANFDIVMETIGSSTTIQSQSLFLEAGKIQVLKGRESDPTAKTSVTITNQQVGSKKIELDSEFKVITKPLKIGNKRITYQKVEVGKVKWVPGIENKGSYITIGDDYFGEKGPINKEDPNILTVSSYNVYLGNADKPDKGRRAKHLQEALAAMDTDVLCLQEMNYRRRGVDDAIELAAYLWTGDDDDSILNEIPSFLENKYTPEEFNQHKYTSGASVNPENSISPKKNGAFPYISQFIDGLPPNSNDIDIKGSKRAPLYTGGGVILSKYPLEMIANITFDALSGKTIAGTKYAEQKGFIVVKITKNGQDYYVLNAHTNKKGGDIPDFIRIPRLNGNGFYEDGEAGLIYQDQQIDQIRKWLQNNNKIPYLARVIVAGDWNADLEANLEDNDIISSKLGGYDKYPSGEDGYNDVYYADGRREKVTFWNRGTPIDVTKVQGGDFSTRQIDWVLYSKLDRYDWPIDLSAHAFPVRNVDFNYVDLSDHIGVTGTFSYRGQWTCTDGIKNQGETAIDCGGPNCSPCPTCFDGIMNQGEKLVDCGGPNCQACPGDLGGELEGGIKISEYEGTNTAKLICEINPGFQGNWEEANNYCQTLNTEGSYGWRLPRIDELELIYSNAYKLGNNPFNLDAAYWSTTMGHISGMGPGSPPHKKVRDFNQNSGFQIKDATENLNCCCVKRLSAPLNEDYGGIVIHDYLVLAAEDIGVFNWEDAKSAPGEYNAGGYTDWRLPTQHELWSIQSNIGALEDVNTEDNTFYWGYDTKNSSYSGSWLVESRLSFGNSDDYKNRPADFLNGIVRPVRSISPHESCRDGVKNGSETGIDCGGFECIPCESCHDMIKNQGETSIDCGGPNCNPCPTCTDGNQNQDETGIDCGGPNCAPCYIEVGKPFQGGIIIHIDDSNRAGLICSPVSLGVLEWQQAELACKSYESEGYDDWYMPSIDELKHIDFEASVRFFPDYYHQMYKLWSSNKRMTGEMRYTWYPDYNEQNLEYVSQSHNVLAFRAFDLDLNEYKVEIDHCHSDLTYEGTNGEITVEFWSGDQLAETSKKKGIVDDCSTGDDIFIVNTLMEVTHVIVNTDSEDAYFIDQLRLYENGSLVLNHNTDYGQGWCLSTDANDAQGAWKGKLVDDICKQSHRFNFQPDEYKVEIDHCHSDLDYEGTSGQITVEFWSGNKMVESRIKNGIADNCPTDDTIFIVNTLESITHVVVKTNSGDAFYIDQLRLYKNGSLNANHGADNGQGWCLSTDANDAHGAWKGKLAQSVCSPSKRFNFR